MRSASILLLLFAFLVLADSKAPKRKLGTSSGNLILKEMDTALESKNFDEFLKMHSNNFHFRFCNVTGKSRSDLEKIFKTDPNMSSTVKSKHFKTHPVELNKGTFELRYEEYLLLKTNELYRTRGSVLYSQGPKIVSAREGCPSKVL